MTSQKQTYGLIGYPLVHSFSKDYFNKKFNTLGIDAQYLNFEIKDISEIHQITAFYHNISGLNVTIPYKETIMRYLDAIDSLAAEIGAVNVIKFKRNDNGLIKTIGYNTDIIGFRDSLAPLLQPHHTHALVLGTGGASKAVVKALSYLGLSVTNVSRRPTPEQIAYSDISTETIHKHTVIINTTPVGMYPEIDQAPDIPYNFLTEAHICYDLIYNPEETLFMTRSRRYGATVKNGLEMLHLQAEAAWQIWTED